MGLTLEDVAKRCDPPTTAKQISRLEKGERRLTLDWIMRLSKSLNCLSSELVPELSQNKTVSGICKRTKQARIDSGFKDAKDIVAALSEQGYVITLDTYYKYENRTPIPHNLIFTFCSLTNVNIEWPLTGLAIDNTQFTVDNIKTTQNTITLTKDQYIKLLEKIAFKGE